MEVRLYLMVSQKKKQKVVLNPKGSYSVACKRKLQKNLIHVQQICTWHQERDQLHEISGNMCGFFCNNRNIWMSITTTH